MTTKKNPQTISRNKNSAKGFVTILLLITWVVIALGFYGIKTGLLQSDAGNPTVDAKIAEVESKTTALESRVTSLEKKLSTIGAALAPTSSGEATDDAKQGDAKPVDTMKPADAPVAVSPAVPASPSEVKKPDAGAVMPQSSEPKMEEKKEDPAAKPQTNNQGNKDKSAALEKKSSRVIASNVVSYQ